jgi:hypothetical protein
MIQAVCSNGEYWQLEEDLQKDAEISPNISASKLTRILPPSLTKT